MDFIIFSPFLFWLQHPRGNGKGEGGGKREKVTHGTAPGFGLKSRV